jgi:hypothetical protein
MHEHEWVELTTLEDVFEGSPERSFACIGATGCGATKREPTDQAWVRQKLADGRRRMESQGLQVFEQGREFLALRNR